MRHVHANLVSSSRFQIHLQLRVVLEAMCDAVMRYSWLTIGHNGHFSSSTRVSIDRGIDFTSAGERTRTNRAIRS